jgi:pyruvate dehydrogenase E2 component (dihydrolipoamide acetyltransferase)
VSKRIEIVVPDIGDFSDIPVIEVLVEAGQHVEAEESLVTLESDKATMEVPSPQSGTISEVRLALNDRVSAGDVVAVMEIEDSPAEPAEAAQAGQPEGGEPESSESESGEPESGEPGADGPAAGESPSDESPADESEPVQAEAGERDRAPVTGESDARDKAADSPAPPHPVAAAVDPAKIPYASPAIRAFARELGVDLSRVRGSGRKGRIVREDVAAFVKTTLSQEGGRAPASGASLDIAPAPTIDFSAFGDTEARDLTRIQRISGPNLHRNWVTIPHVTQHDEADITDMEAFRKANAQDALDQGFKLTPLVFLIKATVAALKKFEQFNSSLSPDGQQLILKRYFNVGIAVDTPEGLVVPVIRECDRKGIMELARELAEVSARARDRKLRPQDLQGGCISISSLGGIGGTAFTPIVNAPEVAILGVARSQMKPVWDGEQFQPRLMLPLSLSYDHRVIDGAAAARFTRYLASRLEDLRRLTL